MQRTARKDSKERRGGPAAGPNMSPTTVAGKALIFLGSLAPNSIDCTFLTQGRELRTQGSSNQFDRLVVYRRCRGACIYVHRSLRRFSPLVFRPVDNEWSDERNNDVELRGQQSLGGNSSVVYVDIRRYVPV